MWCDNPRGNRTRVSGGWRTGDIAVFCMQNTTDMHSFLFHFHAHKLSLIKFSPFPKVFCGHEVMS